MRRRDELLSDARTEINAVLQMKDRISLDRMKEMVADYDETMGANLRAERDALQVLVAEAEQIAAELQALHESDDFRAVAAAVDKFAGTPIQTNVYTVIAAWSTLSDHRDMMVQNTQNELQNVMWTSTEEMLELLTQVNESYGEHMERFLRDMVSEVWHKLAARRETLLTEMSELIGDEHAEILEMEAMLHEFEILPQKMPYVTRSESGWSRVSRSRSEDKTYHRLKTKMLQTIGFGRTEVVHLLHCNVDSVPKIDEVLRLYDRAGSDLTDVLEKLKARRVELKGELMREYEKAIGSIESQPKINMDIIKKLGYFQELDKERDAMKQHNEAVIENARAKMAALLTNKDLKTVVNCAWKFEKFLDGTDLHTEWAELVKYAAHSAADSRKLLNYENQQEKIIKLMALFPDCLRATDDNDRLPLHTAVATRAKLDFIDQMLNIYPDAILHADVNGCLPIHLALLHKVAPEICERLLDIRQGNSFLSSAGCCSCCLRSNGGAQDAAERKLFQILQARTNDITSWKSIEFVHVHGLKRAKPPVLEPTPLHCALQNSDIETPVKIVRMLGWEKIVGWEALAISCSRDDVVFELGDPAKIAQTRPTIAKTQLISLFSKILSCCWCSRRRAAKQTSDEAFDVLVQKQQALAKELALKFEVQLLPIVLLVGLVASNYFDVVTDLMMVIGFAQTGDYAFFTISVGLLATSMILTCVMDFFQSGCKGLPFKILLNITETRLITETYRALQMWKAGLKPQQGFAQVGLPFGLCLYKSLIVHSCVSDQSCRGSV
eukprot:SAG31_NODE_327_length_17650_cov_18.626574_8_plen_781_part_00